jgi:hypothetical protein
MSYSNIPIAGAVIDIEIAPLETTIKLSHGILEANSELREVYEEIGEMAILEENWNEENSPPIDRDSILRAQKFVIWLATVTEDAPLMGETVPMAFPAINGGVSIVWHTQEYLLTIAFSPQQSLVELKEKYLDNPTTSRILSEEEASKAILDFLRKIS